MKGRTTFVIAHRLSTIRNADTILVLEGGQIIEQGDHGELLARGGRYFDLYTRQYGIETNLFLNPGEAPAEDRETEEVAQPAADAAATRLPLGLRRE
jgi:subfamily B ATP-binding cassette protein MsbA